MAATACQAGRHRHLHAWRCWKAIGRAAKAPDMAPD